MKTDARPILVADGFDFPEGPSFDREGNFYVMECDAGRISKVTLDGRVEVFAETGGVPCGSRLHQDGHLFVAENGLAKILDFRAGWDHGRWWRNRLTTSRFGARTTSSSTGTAIAISPILRGQTLEKPVGRVFRVGADGSISVFAVGLAFPKRYLSLGG